MQIQIGSFDFTECWDGTLYKKLSNYPEINAWEIQSILDFIQYEAANGRSCEIHAEDSIQKEIARYAPVYRSGVRVPVPDKITECTACPWDRGCLTDFVCHTTSVEHAVRILACGSILSAVRARNQSARMLQKEARNAANDPEDYFEYVMVAWGNCQAGDRLVMERKLGRFPDEQDLSRHFTPGVRFYFRYKDLLQHPQTVLDGVLPMKVKDGILLKDWVYAIIVPECYQKEVAPYVPKELLHKTYYLPQDCKDIWDWSKKVYEFVKQIT